LFITLILCFVVLINIYNKVRTLSNLWNNNMKNRKIVITGASKGIGKAIAKKFALDDCEIYLISSNEKTLQYTSKEINKGNNSKIHYYATNLKTEQGCNNVLSDIQNNFKDLDTIIFSAGDTKSGDFLSQPIDDFFDGFDLKFYSVVRLLKGLWTNLKQKKGWVVAINGQMANTPNPNFTVGGAVNSALENLCKALSKRGIQDNVNINVIHPGMTSTERLISIIQANANRENISFDQAKENALKASGLDRFSTPEEVAELAYFLCKENVRHINGTSITLDGGIKPTI